MDSDGLGYRKELKEESTPFSYTPSIFCPLGSIIPNLKHEDYFPSFPNT